MDRDRNTQKEDDATTQGESHWQVQKPLRRPAAGRETWNGVSFGATEEINPASTSVLDSRLQNCETTHICC